MIITTIKSINADLRLLNNTLMSYSNYQSGDWLPRCMLKLLKQNQSLKEITLKITALSYVSLKLKTCHTSMKGHFYPISIIQKYAIF